MPLLVGKGKGRNAQSGGAGPRRHLPRQKTRHIGILLVPRLGGIAYGGHRAPLAGLGEQRFRLLPQLANVLKQGLALAQAQTSRRRF